MIFPQQQNLFYYTVWHSLSAPVFIYKPSATASAWDKDASWTALEYFQALSCGVGSVWASK